MKLSEASEALQRIGLSRYEALVFVNLARAGATAEQEALGFTTKKGLQRSYRAGINEVRLAAMRRGVKARLAADVNETNAVLMARVAKFVPLRHVDRQRARFIIVDRDSILAFLIQDEKSIRGEGETPLWTNSPDFVKAHLEFFERSWASGTAPRRRLAELPGR